MKKNVRPLVLAVLMMLMLGACNSAAPNAESSPSAASVGASANAPAATTNLPDPEVPARPLPSGYEILANGEMVQYCLPYPKDEFKENYDLAEYKGQHVLVSKSKKSKITFSGNPVDMTLDALYDKCLADIAAMKGATLVSQNKGVADLSMRWKLGEKVFFMKKWYRDAAQESVTAQFEFPAAEAAGFEVWIADIAGHNTECE